MLVPLCLAVFAAAAEPPAISPVGIVTTIQAPENVWDAAAEDLDGNGFADLLLLCCDERSDPLNKFLAIYLAGDDGTYPQEPSSRCPLDPSVGVLFQAEADGKAPREVVAASALGAQVFAFDGKGLKPGNRVEFSSLFPTRAKSPVFVKNVTTDVEGDGRDEWLVPVPQAYEVWDNNRRRARITCDVYSEMRRAESVSITNRLPAVQPFALDGQPHKALAFLSDEYADFAYGPNWGTHTRVRIPVNVQEKWDANAKMADINNDGFPDLMVTQTKGTVNLESATQIYIAPEPMKYPDKPTATFAAAGSIAAPDLRDVNGDQLRDVVVVRIPFGVKNIVNFFVRRKLSISAEVYLFNGKDFGAKPSFETNLTLDAPEGKEQVAYALEDFNGDGRLDLCVSESRDALSFYAGVEKGFIASKAFTDLKMPSFGNIAPLDLNRNPAKDAVLIRPGSTDPKRVDVIVF